MSVFSYILFLCFIVAVYLAIQPYRRDGIQYRENRLFSLLCFASAIWSMGFWGVNIQTVPERAYLFRGIGMVGVFTYLIVAQLLICEFSGTLKKYKLYIVPISLIGYVICFFIVQKDQVTYQLTKIGMTYRFHPGFWNNAYIVYSLLVAANMFVSILYMLLFTNRRRMRILAKKLLLTEAMVVFGMIFDTILPILGKPAIPGSTIGQFAGLLVIYQAICYVNRSRITIDNMSNYVFSSLTIPILVYDHNRCLQILNGAAYDFMELKGDATGTEGISSLFAISDESAFEFGGKRKEITALCCNNGLQCSLFVSKIHDDDFDVIGYIITVSDLTERLEYISKLEQAIKEAENANESKTRFLANMSHEIRTPMNAIIGFSELALKKDISSEVREYINGIRLSSKNLLAIINDILDITKIESGKMEVIPDYYYTADMLDDVSLIISQQAMRKGLSFEMKTDENIPTKLFGDKVRLRGVLINILNNAVKYTKEGSVTFEIKILSQIEDVITFAFIVSDTGIGIKPEDREKLFTSFERFDQQMHYGVEGSGLGLSIAKGYVSLMGGEITVDSVYGEGSVFTITLNQKVVDATPLHYQFTIDRFTQENAVTSRLVIHDTRVLLVDDNHINLMVAKGLLASYGLLVDIVSSGAAAVDACQSTKYPIVFMDQMMPEMDGIEAMQKIRELDPYYAKGGQAKIIVLTADAIRGVREKLLGLGFDEYLGKPMNLKQLERLLRQYVPDEKQETIAMTDEEAHVSKETEESEPEMEIPYLQKTLPDVDVAVGLENAGGKIADYLEILKINYTYGKKNLEELEGLLDMSDYKNYTIKVHSMKSTAKGIGALKVSDMALKQEEAGRAGDYAYINAHFEAYSEKYRELLCSIEEVLRHYQMLEEETQEKEFLDHDIINNVLSNIRHHVENFEFAQVFEILEDMKKYELPDDSKELFARLEAMMDDLAVEDIGNLLDEALSGEDE